MNRATHIEMAEQLLDTAKDIARRKPETAEDRKADQVIVMDLLDFARTHATIAAAIGDEGIVSQLANIANALRHMR